jgi:hypothetical protein
VKTSPARTIDSLKQLPHPREMSVASMRVELIDLLSVLFPDKTWPKRVAAREVAEWTIETLPRAIEAWPDRGRPHAQRALHLAEVIRQRSRR